MTYQELMETIAARVAALWPERTLYRDFCPVDFKRPSGFLYVTQADRADANLGLVRWDFAAELTLFAATDSYTAESTEALRAGQNAGLTLFAGPSIQVGDRKIAVYATASAPGPGEAYVTFTASWIDARPGYHDPEDPNDQQTAGIPLMEHFEINNPAGTAGNGKEGTP